MSTNNSNAVISVEVSRGDDGKIDVAAIVASAKTQAEALRATDDQRTDTFISALNEVLAIPEVAALDRLEADILATMATRFLDPKLLSQKNLAADMKETFTAFLKGQSEYHYVAKGKGAGFRVKSKMAPEALAKLIATSQPA